MLKEIKRGSVENNEAVKLSFGSRNAMKTSLPIIRKKADA